MSPSIQSFSDFEIGLDEFSLAFENPFTPGDAMIVCVGSNADIVTPTDEGGNVYTLGFQTGNGIGTRIAIYYSLGAADPGLVTATAPGGSFVDLLLIEEPPCSSARASVGDSFTTGPVEIPIDMVAGDIVIGFSKALDSTFLTGGLVNGVAAPLFDSELGDLAGFDAFANATGLLNVQALNDNEGSVFGALVALSLIPAASGGTVDSALLMGSATLL